jgi:hypothetical protein
MDNLPGTARQARWVLVAGDALTYALVTLAGFAFHREAAAQARFLATYLPFFGAWCVAAAALGAFDPARAARPEDLWRPAVAVVFASPLGAVVRGAWLGFPVLPLFVGVFGLTSLCAVMVWRTLFLVASRRRPR